MGIKTLYVPKGNIYIVTSNTSGYVFPWQFESEDASDLFEELYHQVGRVQVLKSPIGNHVEEDAFMGSVNFYATKNEMIELWEKYKKEYELGTCPFEPDDEEE